jgi:hypothetical protein
MFCETVEREHDRLSVRQGSFETEPSGCCSDELFEFRLFAAPRVVRGFPQLESRLHVSGR